MLLPRWFAVVKVGVLGLVIFALVGLGLRLGWLWRDSDAAASAAVVELQALGATQGELRRPRIESPAGAKAILHASSSSGFSVDRNLEPALESSVTGPMNSWGSPSSELPAERGSSPPPAGPATGDSLPWPAPGDLACDTQLDVWLVGRKPWGRANWTAKLQGPRGGILTERSGRGEDLELQLSPAAAPPRWRLDLLAGMAVPFAAVEAPELEAGFAWTGRRHGGYILGGYRPAGSEVPAAWRIHAGYRLSLR